MAGETGSVGSGLDLATLTWATTFLVILVNCTSMFIATLTHPRHSILWCAVATWTSLLTCLLDPAPAPLRVRFPILIYVEIVDHYFRPAHSSAPHYKL